MGKIDLTSFDCKTFHSLYIIITWPSGRVRQTPKDSPGTALVIFCFRLANLHLPLPASPNKALRSDCAAAHFTLRSQSHTFSSLVAPATYTTRKRRSFPIQISFYVPAPLIIRFPFLLPSSIPTIYPRLISHTTMNCPSRTDELPRSDGMNQNPNALSNDLTTNEDLNGVANGRRLRRSASPPLQDAGFAGSSNRGGIGVDDAIEPGGREKAAFREPATTRVGSRSSARRPSQTSAPPSSSHNNEGSGRGNGTTDNAEGGALDAGGQDGGAWRKGPAWKVVSGLGTFRRFVGPGFIVSVAYSKFSSCLCLCAKRKKKAHLVSKLSKLSKLTMTTAS